MFKDFYLKVKLEHPDAKMPTRAHDTDAGCDVYAVETFVIPPRSVVKVPLGFRVEFSPGYVMVMQDKSGRAAKDKYESVGGIIDAGYRGICHACLASNSDFYITIAKGEKISQFLILPCWTGQPEQVEEINEDTQRGAGGFGSTSLT